MHGHGRLRRAAERGFSLVELMVVIAIIGLLSTIVAINVRGAHGTAAAQKARADLRQICDAITLFQVQEGRLPSGLEELVDDSGGEAVLRGGRAALTDPWKHPYQLLVPGADGRPFSVMTYGGDGAPGGAGEKADITLSE